MRNYFSYFALLLIVMISGCTTVPKEPNLPQAFKEGLWQARLSELKTITQWKMLGRLGLRLPDQSGSMSVEWLQKQQDFIVYLDGPLGKSLAKIEQDALGVVVEASGKRYEGHSPEMLLYELTGWMLPVSYLRYWVQGMPVPEVAGTTMLLDNKGQLQQLQQAGWTIDYLDYEALDYKANIPVSLPGRIKIVKNDIEMTLVARSWKLK